MSARYHDMWTDIVDRAHVREDLWAKDLDAVTVSLVPSAPMVLWVPGWTLEQQWASVPWALQYLRRWDLNPVYPKSIYDPFAVVTLTDHALLSDELRLRMGMGMGYFGLEHMGRVEGLIQAWNANASIAARIPECH